MQPEAPRGYLSMADVSELLTTDDDRWPVHRVRRWLKREGATVRKGRYLYTTRSKLRAAWRDVFGELFSLDF